MTNRKKLRGILFWLLVTVFSLYAIYVANGSPALSPEMGMRQAEKRDLVGPSRLIGTVEAVSEDYDCMLFGETEYGYCFYLYDDEFRLWDAGRLTYVEKDTRTCFLTENVYWETDTVMPVFAITPNPRAVSARLTLETECDENPLFVGTCTSQTELTYGAFYQFAMDITDLDSTVVHFWGGRLQNERWGYSHISGTATLELFDREGNLIDTVVTEYPANQ